MGVFSNLRRAIEVQTMLPESTVLGKLSIIETYEFYDMPILFACRNKAGHVYLAVWIDRATDNDTWLYVALSRRRFQEIKAGRIDLHDAFGKPEDELALEVKVYFDPDRRPEIRPVPARDLDEDRLPLPGDYLDPQFCAREDVWSFSRSRQHTAGFWGFQLSFHYPKLYSGRHVLQEKPFRIRYVAEAKPFRFESFEKLRIDLASQASSSGQRKTAGSEHSWGESYFYSLDDPRCLELIA